MIKRKYCIETIRDMARQRTLEDKTSLHHRGPEKSIKTNFIKAEICPHYSKKNSVRCHCAFFLFFLFFFRGDVHFL